MTNQVKQFHILVESNFHLFIPLSPETAQEEMQQAISKTMLVEKAARLMTKGGISPEELLEMVEPVIETSNMDDYIEEIEEGLTELYLV